MQGGSMTQRENALPGLAGLLSMSLTKGGLPGGQEWVLPPAGAASCRLDVPQQRCSPV